MEKIREIVTDYHAGKFWEETVYEAKDVRTVCMWSMYILT